MICNNIIINGVNPVFELETKAFKEFSIMENLNLPCDKPDIKTINALNVDAVITDFEVVKTPVTKANYEGVISTGYKLIIKGILEQIVEYVAFDGYAQNVNFSVPFSTYIVLPETYEMGNSISVNAIIEDAYIEKVSERGIYKNIVLLAYAEVCCGIADTTVYTPYVKPSSSSITVDSEGINTFNILVPFNNVDTKLYLGSDPEAEIINITDIPTGYSFADNILSIDYDVTTGAALMFEIVATPCNIPFYVNVDFVEKFAVELVNLTTNSVLIEEIYTNSYDVKYDPTAGSAEILFESEDEIVVTSTETLPEGYYLKENTLFADSKATSNNLEFLISGDDVEYFINLNFWVEEVAIPTVLSLQDDIVTVTQTEDFVYTVDYLSTTESGDIIFDISETAKVFSEDTLPQGYTLNENVLTIDTYAKEDTLLFTVEDSALSYSITLNIKPTLITAESSDPESVTVTKNSDLSFDVDFITTAEGTIEFYVNQNITFDESQTLPTGYSFELSKDGIYVLTIEETAASATLSLVAYYGDDVKLEVIVNSNVKDIPSNESA